MSEATPQATPAQEPEADKQDPQNPGQQPAQEPKGTETDWKAEARKWEQRAKDNGKERDDIKSAQQQQLDDIAMKLGLKPDDNPPDPTKLAEQVAVEQGKTAEAEARATTAERQLAVFKAAGAHDGNAVALVDSSSFMSSIKDVDLTDAAALGEAIKQAVEANPHFKATSATPSFNGGPRNTPAPRGTGLLGAALQDRFAGTNR